MPAGMASFGSNLPPAATLVPATPGGWILNLLPTTARRWLDHRARPTVRQETSVAITSQTAGANEAHPGSKVRGLPVGPLTRSRRRCNTTRPDDWLGLSAFERRCQDRAHRMQQNPVRTVPNYDDPVKLPAMALPRELFARATLMEEAFARLAFARAVISHQSIP